MNNNEARLMVLLNYMNSDVLKRYLHEVCSRNSFRTAIYNLPYLNPKEGSMFTHVLDVGSIVRAIWEMKEKSLNYDYLIVASLLHEYKLFDENLVNEFESYLKEKSLCENAISLIINTVTAVTDEHENVLTTKTAESVIVRYAKKSAEIISVCDTEAEVKDGQKYYVDYPRVPIFIRPITIK